MTRLRRLVRQERGASAVEFALVAPLLVLLLLGLIDWGYYFFAAQVVTNAAREGARSGSLDGKTAAQAQSDAAVAAEAYLAAGGFDPARATVIATLTSDSVSVKVSYPTGSLSGLNGLVLPAQATATAEMRR